MKNNGLLFRTKEKLRKPHARLLFTFVLQTNSVPHCYLSLVTFTIYWQPKRQAVPRGGKFGEYIIVNPLRLYLPELKRLFRSEIGGCIFVIKYNFIYHVLHKLGCLIGWNNNLARDNIMERWTLFIWNISHRHKIMQGNKVRELKAHGSFPFFRNNFFTIV